MRLRFRSAAVRFDFLSRRFSLRFFAATDFVFLPPLSSFAPCCGYRIGRHPALT